MCAASRTAALEVKVAEMECRSRGLLPAVKGIATECKKRKTIGIEPVENTFMYLSECRAEALDALTALRKTRHKSKRQAEKLEAANSEISRLKEELAMRKQELSQQPSSAVTYILPKRALSLAGFWNLSPNDLLCVTPILIQAAERLGGTVIRRDGLQACFSSHDRALLVDAAVETMAEHLPQYVRRLEF
jgi:hypothetical protein